MLFDLNYQNCWYTFVLFFSVFGLSILASVLFRGLIATVVQWTEKSTSWAILTVIFLIPTFIWRLFYWPGLNWFHFYNHPVNLKHKLQKFNGLFHNASSWSIWSHRQSFISHDQTAGRDSTDSSQCDAIRLRYVPHFLFCSIYFLYSLSPKQIFLLLLLFLYTVSEITSGWNTFWGWTSFWIFSLYFDLYYIWE